MTCSGLRVVFLFVVAPVEVVAFVEDHNDLAVVVVECLVDGFDVPVSSDNDGRTDVQFKVLVSFDFDDSVLDVRVVFTQTFAELSAQLGRGRDDDDGASAFELVVCDDARGKALAVATAPFPQNDARRVGAAPRLDESTLVFEEGDIRGGRRCGFRFATGVGRK